MACATTDGQGTSQSLCDIEARQTKQYAALFRLFDEYKDVIARVSFWNLHDGQSWLNYFPWQRTNYPLLFDRDLETKPVYDKVIEVLQQGSPGPHRKDQVFRPTGIPTNTSR